MTLSGRPPDLNPFTPRLAELLTADYRVVTSYACTASVFGSYGQNGSVPSASPV